MQLQALTTTLLISASFSGLATPTSEFVGFQPRRGSEATKTFSRVETMTTEEFELSLGGQSMASGGGSTITTTIDLEVIDTYGPVAEGRPTQLTRAYDTVERTTESEGMGEGMMTAGEGNYESELSGHVVDFRWNAEDGAYDRAFAEDDDGEDEWLEGLSEDLDFRMLLPTGDITEGDTWEPEMSALEIVMQPGGNLQLSPRPADEGDGAPEGALRITVPSADESRALEDFDGDFTMTCEGFEERDGFRFAILSMEVDVEADLDAVELIIEDMIEDGVEDPQVDSATMSYALEGKGKLTWNLGDGHVHAFEFRGEVATTTEAAYALEAMGQQLDIELYNVRTGTVELDVEVE